MDYGFGAGPEKAIGRGKQEGDQHVVYGGVEHSSSGGGFDSEEKEDEQETGRFDSGEGGFRRTIFRSYYEVLLPPVSFEVPPNNCVSTVASISPSFPNPNCRHVNVFKKIISCTLLRHQTLGIPT